MSGFLKAFRARRRRAALFARRVQPTQAELDAAIAREKQRMQDGAYSNVRKRK